MAKKLSCPKCDRSFSMPGHLARHMSATHGVKSKAAKRTKAKRRGRPAGSGAGRRGRPSASASTERRGRPSALVARLGLRSMSLEQLGEVIDAARSEAQYKLSDLHDRF